MSKTIGSLEETILLIVIILGDTAYAVTISEEYKKQFEKSITIPAIHTVLRRLEEKGLIKSRVGGATNLRGGRSKRYYSITKVGYETTKALNEQRTALWDLAPKISFN
jgi:PadR family transcriptional regulator